MVTVTQPATETERTTYTRINDRRRARDASKQAESNPMPPNQDNNGNPLEWFMDDDEISREDDDPFHILLLNETFVMKPRMTVQYVASSCSYVLGMPFIDAEELASCAQMNGFSCLGTWSHEECLTLGAQLQQRDLIVRVVPFVEGGNRFWQARDGGVGASEDGLIKESGGLE